MKARDEIDVMSTDDRLLYMANQIARNLATESADEAIEMVENHLRLFWDPAMRERIVRLAAARPAELMSVAESAVQRLAATR